MIFNVYWHGDRMTLVGGINSLSLASGDRQRIRWEVQQAIRVLSPTHRFILHLRRNCTCFARMPSSRIHPGQVWKR